PRSWETGANNSARPMPRCQPRTPAGLTSQCIGTVMTNSPYLDRPFIPLAVALPQMLATIAAKLTDKIVSARQKPALSPSRIDTRPPRADLITYAAVV